MTTAVLIIIALLYFCIFAIILQDILISKKYGCDDCIYNNDNGLCDIRIAKVENNSYCRIKKRKIKVI